jgi:hypothetical protein
MASTYTPIATTTLGSAASSYTFSSIPGTYTDLVLVGKFGMSGSYNNGVKLQYNGNTSTVYSTTELRGNGTTAGSGQTTGQNGAWIVYDLGAGQYVYSSTVTVNILNYTNTGIGKTAISRHSKAETGVAELVSFWNQTAAITSIAVVPDTGGTLLAGSTFTLYGIKAA